MANRVILWMLIHKLAYVWPKGGQLVQVPTAATARKTYHGIRSIRISYGVISRLPMDGTSHSGFAFMFSTLGQMRY